MLSRTRAERVHRAMLRAHLVRLGGARVGRARTLHSALVFFNREHSQNGPGRALVTVVCLRLNTPLPGVDM